MQPEKKKMEKMKHIVVNVKNKTETETKPLLLLAPKEVGRGRRRPSQGCPRYVNHLVTVRP